MSYIDSDDDFFLLSEDSLSYHSEEEVVLPPRRQKSAIDVSFNLQATEFVPSFDFNAPAFEISKN